MSPTTEALHLIIKLITLQHATGVSFGTWPDADINRLQELAAELPK